MTPTNPTPSELAAELKELAKNVSPAPWEWHWRADDKDAPGSIAWNVAAERSTAIAMCPRYGTEHFPGDAALIVALRNNLPTIPAALDRAAGRGRPRRGSPASSLATSRRLRRQSGGARSPRLRLALRRWPLPNPPASSGGARHAAARRARART